MRRLQHHVPTVETKSSTGSNDSHRGPIVGPQQFNPWNFVWLAVAAFVAYELGRGSDAAASYAEPTASRRSAGMHPDA